MVRLVLLKEDSEEIDRVLVHDTQGKENELLLLYKERFSDRVVAAEWLCNVFCTRHWKRFLVSVV